MNTIFIKPFTIEDLGLKTEQISGWEGIERFLKLVGEGSRDEKVIIEIDQSFVPVLDALVPFLPESVRFVVLTIEGSTDIVRDISVRNKSKFTTLGPDQFIKEFQDNEREPNLLEVEKDEQRV